MKHSRTRLLVLLLVTVAAAVPAAAGEWDNPFGGPFEGLRGLGLSAGVFLPFDSGVQSLYPPVWGGLNLSYTVPKGEDSAHRLGIGYQMTTRKVDSGFIFDYYTPSVFRSDAMFQMIPITYTYLAGPGARGGGQYFGFGPGLYVGGSQVSAQLTTLGETLEDKNTLWSARVGVHAVVGYALSRHFALEGTYVHLLGRHQVLEYQGDSIARRFDGVSFSLNGKF